MNLVELSGKITRDPEIRFVGDKRFPILSLNVAVDDAEGRYNPESRKTEVGSGFYQVEVRGDYAESLSGQLNKGTPVYVKGSLSQWTMKPKEGEQYGETKTRISATIVVPLTGSPSGGGVGRIAPPANPAGAWGNDWPDTPGF